MMSRVLRAPLCLATKKLGYLQTNPSLPGLEGVHPFILPMPLPQNLSPEPPSATSPGIPRKLSPTPSPHLRNGTPTSSNWEDVCWLFSDPEVRDLPGTLGQACCLQEVQAGFALFLLNSYLLMCLLLHRGWRTCMLLLNNCSPCSIPLRCLQDRGFSVFTPTCSWFQKTILILCWTSRAIYFFRIRNFLRYLLTHFPHPR